jgi:hypothetical protein
VLIYALRTLRRSPAFTATVTLTLALGIGASTAVFSAMDRLLLRSLPYPEPDRLSRSTKPRPARASGPSPWRTCSTGARRALRSTAWPDS